MPRPVTPAREVSSVGYWWTAGLSWLDRYRLWPLWAIGCLFFSTTIPRARATPFWHDELYTVLLARLPTAADLWGAVREGIDLMPPLNVLLARLTDAVVNVEGVSPRLPAMIGFWTMSLVAFRLVRDRSSVLLAFTAALLPWYTLAYRYSYEARSYGVMLGLFALVLWSWSDAARGRRRYFSLMLLAVSGAATIWNHYFGVVTLVPVALGEIVRSIRSRRIDKGMVAAGVVAALLCVPLVQPLAAAAGQGATYWRHAEWADVRNSYALLFKDLPVARDLLLLLVLSMALGAFRRPLRLPSAIVPVHEAVAGGAALLIPIMAVALGRQTGGYAVRYALSTIVGGIVVIPLLVFWLSRGGRLAQVVMLAVLARGVLEPSVAALAHPPQFRDPLLSRPVLVAELHKDLPLVIAGPTQFLQVWYYTPPGGRERLWYVADPASAVRYKGSDTADLGFLKLSHRVSLGLHRPADLAGRPFRLYDDGNGWLPAALEDAGATLTDEGRELEARVRLVTWPRTPEGGDVIFPKPAGQ